MSMCKTRQLLLNRRSILQNTACGFGWLAFSAMLAKETFAGTRRTIGNSSPGPNVSGSAKRVIFLSMRGGPSHVDTFDYKPALDKVDGQAGPRPGSKWMKSPWNFSQRGDSGLWISELFPELAKTADSLAIVNSMQTDV
ncbi:MAG: DUF1501 domain-containing protein, partial [Planctomycetes bacterium]|nr:DUF1501 domain-containing protein [Planctomycetota bacterium]